MSDKRWILFKTPGVGDVIAWVDPEELPALGVITAENVTRLVPARDGVNFMKMADALPLNMMAIPIWLPCPDEFVEPISKLWDRLYVPEKKIVRND